MEGLPKNFWWGWGGWCNLPGWNPGLGVPGWFAQAKLEGVTS